MRFDLMDIKVNRTQAGITRYPMHSHKLYEIMHYTSGKGVMRTEAGDIPFSPGTIIVIPPSLRHGSVADGEFENISVESDFGGLCLFDSPVSIVCDGDDDGAGLIEMIWENRYKNESYLSALLVAYVWFVLQKTSIENSMSICVSGIIKAISDSAFDSDIDVAAILRKSGYAEDYVRAAFKRETGKTPIGFLTELRVKHACYLIDIYKDTLSLAEISEQCGYMDYVYFSRKFKEIVGISPLEYKNQVK